MWSYKTHIDGGPFMCYRLILYQAFIQPYPTMATYYLALAYNQASGQARTRIMGGQGTRKMSFAFLLFAGYFSMYCVNLWLQWSYWLRLGNGRTREAFRTALLLKALRMPEHQRPLPGYFSGVVVPRVDELVDCWHQFFVLCGIPFASTTTMHSPPPAPRMLDDHELPRPPIARNEKGLGSTWSDA